ncbi:MAG: MBL fold metallo-hydrolase [Methylocystaceae bacterium]
MQVHVLASGSSGNSVLIAMGGTHILVDAGISTRRIEQGLKEVGIAACDLDAVLITHEHSDHISGLDVLCRRYKLPVYTRPATWKAMTLSERFPTECCRPLESHMTIGGMDVIPFSISHDAADPVGFSFFHQGQKCVLATDLGVVTPEVASAIADAEVLVLESNHDPGMLAEGSYPYYLKQRIRSQVGHLSNLDCARLLGKTNLPSGAHVFLAHLSQQNNTPSLAEKTVEDHLTRCGCEVGRELVLHRTYPGLRSTLILE